MTLIVKEPERKKKDPTSWAKYTWTLTEQGYILRVDSDFLARVYQDGAIWRTAIRTKAGVERDEHKNLEAAAKFADHRLYKCFPHVWTVTNARVIIAPWKGDLTCQ